MSAVSFQNESLPTFEPINPVSQKRKRSILQDADSQPMFKKTKAKRGLSDTASAIINKSAVWIGATLKEENGILSAAFSVYYGLNDARNCTEKMNLQHDQDLNYVYTMGAFRALELGEDDTSILRIYTGSESLEQNTNLDVNDESEICKQLLEKIAKRKGSTFILYKTSSSFKHEEYQVAHEMAKEALSEDNMMVIESETLVDLLEMKESKLKVTTNAITTEKLIMITHDDKVKLQEKEKVKIGEEVACSSSVNADLNAAQNWTFAFSLHNLLDILKAPFSRKNKQ